ncbi:B3 domain-containing protein Os04g0386900-like isoform X2 [Typha angustifolia]|uniref:B3 domain-containing protein Os04g0386900-like isoform X2 n=1 Tax=Typha angustifolia TaxID=59011 RepID=UPI003C308E43
MSNPSLCDLNTQTQDSRNGLRDQSFSMQGSCNLAGQLPGSNSSKNKKVIGSHDSITASTGPTKRKQVQNPIVPLSGYPYFTCILSKSQVQAPFRLVIPKAFHPFLPSCSVHISISCGNRTWEMKYRGNCLLKKFETGWKIFAIDNNLKIGDGCVFELMDSKNLKFRAQILRGEIPSMVVSNADGQNFNSPIMID